MLLRHSAFYLLARGIPGAINLLAVVFYTRLLTPGDYGRYALVVASVGLCNAVGFQWLTLGLLRFLPSREQRPEVLLSTLAASFLILVGLTGLAAVAALVVIDDPGLRPLVVIGTVLLWVQALFQLRLDFVRSQLAPGRYGALAISKAVLALGCGVALAYAGLGALGLLLGLLLGMVATLIGPARSLPRLLQWRAVDGAVARRLIAYGMPLSASSALDFVLTTSDRFLIGWLLDEATVGRYAIAYDLAQQGIGVLLMAVNLAAYPLAVRALEQGGTEAARLQIRRNLNLLLLVGLPATVGLALLADDLADTLLGQAFRSDAPALIRLVALAALLSGIQGYYVDLSFQLGRRTIFFVWISLIAAVVNLGLNLWWIPALGIRGAAAATVVAYVVGLGASLVFGRRAFPLPGPDLDSARIVLATAVMAVILWALPAGAGWLALRVGIGMAAFGGALGLLGLARGRFRLGGRRRPAPPAGPHADRWQAAKPGERHADFRT